MPDVKSTLQSKVIDLAGEAFSGFCDDIGGMFGVDMSCEQLQIHEHAGAEIKKSYKKLSVVYSVQSTGTLKGEFQVLLDKAGLFTMAGVLVMLPANRILDTAKRGTLADTENMSDAVGEVGNLLIGSWDRIFRTGLKDDTHFLHAGTFMGDPCAEDNGVLDPASHEEAVFVSHEMSVGEYPPFKCGVCLPSSLFEESASAIEPETPNGVEQEVPEEAESEPEAVMATEEHSGADVETTVAADVEEEAPVVVEPEPAAERTPEPQETPAVVKEAPQVEAVAVPTPTPMPTPVRVTTPEPPAATVSSPSFNPGIGLLAKHLMQRQVHWATKDETVNQAQTRMQELGASYFLIGNGHKLEGIVTQSDLASAASIYLRPIFAKWRSPEDDATLQIQLKLIMSKQIYVVKPETPLSNIVHLRCRYDISYLPVVDVQGQVQGVVTVQDALKAIVDRELCAASGAVA